MSDAADIVSVVSVYVALEKAGGKFKARCPFHEERTPSFWVDPANSTFHCFGCGAHGSTEQFLAEYVRLHPPAPQCTSCGKALTPSNADEDGETCESCASEHRCWADEVSEHRALGVLSPDKQAKPS